MGRLLPTFIALVVLTGLAVLAVLAFPGGSPLAEALPLPERGSAAAVQAGGTARYNAIAMPLDASQQFPFNAEGLAALIGPSVQQVLRLDANRQAFDSWLPASHDGEVGGAWTNVPFSLTVGGAYWVLLDQDSPPVVSFAGNVPEPGAIRFTLVAGGPSCSYNALSIPLDRSAITDADELAASIGVAKVEQVLRLDAARQAFDSWFPASRDGEVGGAWTDRPFDVRAGYPYWVCLKEAADGQVWP